MLRNPSSVLLLVLLLSATSCTYAVDRLRDAADILTLTFGTGDGVQARVGPLTTGLMFNEGNTGLQHGTFTSWKTNKRQSMMLAFMGMEMWQPQVDPDEPQIAEQRNKACRELIQYAWTAETKPDTSVPTPYWTNVEAQVGVIFSIQAGFNIGELADFALGWFGIDFYGDDIAGQQKEPEQATPAESS